MSSSVPIRKHTLHRHEAEPRAEQHGLHQRVAGEQDRRQAAGVEQDDGAARVDVGRLGEEAEREQAQECNIPKREHAADVRLECQVVRQRVLAVDRGRQHEDAGRHAADREEAQPRSGVAIGGEVIGRTHQYGDRDDHDRVGEERRDGHHAARERSPRPQRVRGEHMAGHDTHDDTLTLAGTHPVPTRDRRCGCGSYVARSVPARRRRALRINRTGGRVKTACAPMQDGASRTVTRVTLRERVPAKLARAAPAMHARSAIKVTVAALPASSTVCRAGLHCPRPDGNKRSRDAKQPSARECAKDGNAMPTNATTARFPHSTPPARAGSRTRTKASSARRPVLGQETRRGRGRRSSRSSPPRSITIAVAWCRAAC